MPETVPTLVEPEWLESRLHDPDLRVVDCTVHLTYDNETGEMNGESGRSEWNESHIPGSVFVDLFEDLSETDDPEYSFQLPAPEDFAAEMESAGIGDETRVVAYDDPRDGLSNEWAARFWWMLQAYGHEQVGVLNGGWKRWTRENRPVSDSSPPTREVTFTPDFRPERHADKDDVVDSVSEETETDACVVNALWQEDYAELRIPNSENVPSVGDQAIIDTETNTYLPTDEIRQRFTQAGATDDAKVITYCGGGIAASSAALAARAAGFEDVAVYDGSMEEWRADPGLPTASDD